MKNLLTKKQLIALHREMVGYGPRLTGSPAHQRYIDMLKREMEKLGYETHTDTLIMKQRWEPKRWALKIQENGRVRTIKKVTYYPYSGCTPPEGVSGRMHYCGKGFGIYNGARGKIAVVEMPVIATDIGLVMKKRSVYPANVRLPEKIASPVISSFLLFPAIRLARQAGAKAVICVMSGCSYGNSANQYLPFITAYQDCPALWVNGAEGKRIIELAKQGGCANLTLEAVYEHSVPTETFYAILPGKSKKETIMVNTHTDGTNAFEENAGIGLLSLAKYFAAKPIAERERTIIFSFVTGHFQLHQFGSAVNQATNRFLFSHSDYWSGGKKGCKAVAGITMEHLGCSEWRDNADHTKYIRVNKIEPELVYIGNDALNKVYLSCLKGRQHTRTLTLRPKNFVHFGEGQPFYRYGVPCISLVPGPDYLCNVAKNGYIEKTNYDLMYEQIVTFAKVIEKIDKMPADEIGVNDFFNFGFKL